MRFAEQIDEYFGRLKTTIDNLDRKEIDKLLEILLDAYAREASIYIFGNGGSASTASHFACDMNKGVSYGLDKKFRVIPLTDNMATILAYSNDVSYDDIFVEQLKNFLREGDVVIGISGSGNSENVLRAIALANSRGNTSVGLTGFNGGKLTRIATHSVNANIDDMQVSEDIHLILSHLSMSLLQEVLGDKTSDNPD